MSCFDMNSAYFTLSAPLMASNAEPVALSGTEGRLSIPAPAMPPAPPPPPGSAPALPPPGKAPAAPLEPFVPPAPPVGFVMPPAPLVVVPLPAVLGLPPALLPEVPGFADWEGLSEPQAATDSRLS